MKPILYEDIPLEGLGLGTLADAISCEVTHEVNGVYDLKVTYPVTGIHYGEIQNDRIVLAKPDILSPDQMFRIYRVTKPINGVVSIYAHHVAYDMSGFIVNPFSATDLSGALTAAITNAVPSCPFTLESPRTVASPLIVKEPLPLWQLLGGTKGSFLDTYGGEWDFNNLTATLRTRLGTDRGVSVRYGKNMTDLDQDASLESTYKGVYPYWYDEDGNVLVNLPEKIIEIPDGVGKRIMILDLSGEWEEAPTVAELRTRAERYIHDNKVGEPKITWKVKFVDLSQSGESLAVLEQVMLGDDVTVVYEELGVNASSRVVKTEFDTLGERYISVTLGRVKQNLAKILAGTKDEIKEAISVAKVGLERAVDHATDFITNGSGYMRFIYDGDELKEIVSLDHPDIDQAQSVWRWNNGGFGHSSTGYNGPYTTAITQDGSIVADFITTGNLNANTVQVTGILKDELGKNYWNMATGEFVLRNGMINIETSPSSADIIVLRSTQTKVTINTFAVTIDQTEDSPVPYMRAQLTSLGLSMMGDETQSGLGISRASISHRGFWVGDSSGDTVARLWAPFTSAQYGRISLYAYNDPSTSDHLEAVTLDYSGLKIKNSSGMQVGYYPPNFKFFRQEVTLYQQYCTLNDSQFRTDSVVFAQIYYSGNQTSLTATVTPQITQNGACILYFRMPSGTIPDGTKVWVQILIIGGTA